MYYITPLRISWDPPKKGVVLACLSLLGSPVCRSFVISFLEKQQFLLNLPKETVGKLHLHCLADWSVSVPLARDGRCCEIGMNVWTVFSSESFIMNMFMFPVCLCLCDVIFGVNIRMMSQNGNVGSQGTCTFQKTSCI